MAIPHIPDEISTQICDHILHNIWIEDTKLRAAILLELALTNHLFCDRVRKHRFTSCKLKVGPGALRKGVDILTLAEVQPYVKCLTFIPKPTYEKPIRGYHRDVNVEIVQSSHWFPEISLQLMRLFTSARQYLEYLSVEIRENFGIVECQIVHFVVSRALSSMRFPKMRLLRLDNIMVGNGMPFWNVLSASINEEPSSPPPNIKTEARSTPDTEMENHQGTFKVEAPSSPISKTEEEQASTQRLHSPELSIEEVLSAMPLKSLQIHTLRQDTALQTLPVQYLKSLNDLVLRRVLIGDRLSELISTLPNIRTVHLSFVRILEDVDRWEYIFDNCASLPDIKKVHIQFVGYKGVTRVPHWGLCSYFQADEDALKRLFQPKLDDEDEELQDSISRRFF